MAAMFSPHFKSAAFTCRAQDPGMHKAEQRALWRERLTNQRLQFNGFFVIRSKYTINFVCFESLFGQEN